MGPTAALIHTIQAFPINHFSLPPLHFLTRIIFPLLYPMRAIAPHGMHTASNNRPFAQRTQRYTSLPAYRTTHLDKLTVAQVRSTPSLLHTWMFIAATSPHFEPGEINPQPLTLMWEGEKHFNIIFSFTSRFPKRYPSFKVSHQNPVRISVLSHPCHMPRPSSSSSRKQYGNTNYEAPQDIFFPNLLSLPTSLGQTLPSAPDCLTPSA